MHRQPKEAFTKTERRDWAETVLDNPELLMMYAQSSGAVSSFHSFLAQQYIPSSLFILLFLPSKSLPPSAITQRRLKQSPTQTVPATRFRFKKIMCGLDDDEDDDDDDDEPIPEISGPRASYNHQQQQQQKYHGQGGQSLRMSAAQQHQQHQQRGRGEGGSRSGRR